jgi:hypothetical protein
MFTVFVVAAKINESSAPQENGNKEEKKIKFAPFLYFITVSALFVNLAGVSGLYAFIGVILLRRFVASLALYSLQGDINLNEGNNHEKNEMLVSDFVCLVLAVFLIGMSFYAGMLIGKNEIPSDEYQKQIADSSVWKEQVFAGGFAVSLPFELERDAALEARYADTVQREINGIKNATVYSKETQTFYVSEERLEYRSALAVNWNIIAENVAKMYNTDISNLKVEYKIFGNSTGRLFSYNDEKFNNNVLIVYSDENLWTLNIKNVNAGKLNRAADKIIQSVSIKK